MLLLLKYFFFLVPQNLILNVIYTWTKKKDDSQTRIQIRDCRHDDYLDAEVENTVTSKSKLRLRNNLGNLFAKSDFLDNEEWTSKLAEDNNIANAEDNNNNGEENLNSSPIPFLVDSAKNSDNQLENIEDQTFPHSYEMANLDFNADEDQSSKSKPYLDFNEYLENQSVISSTDLGSTEKYLKPKDITPIDMLNTSENNNTLNNTKTDSSADTANLLKEQNYAVKTEDLFSLTINKSENNSETTTSELESMERFERPSKHEMEKKQAEKQKRQKEQLALQQRALQEAAEEQEEEEEAEEEEEETKDDDGLLTPINTDQLCQSEEDFEKMEPKTASFLAEEKSFQSRVENSADEQYEKEMTENNSDIIELNTEMIDLISNVFSNPNNQDKTTSGEKQVSVLNSNTADQQRVEEESRSRPVQLPDDMTDVSDDEQNIFSSANLDPAERIQLNSSMGSGNSLRPQQQVGTPRNLPLRRESFEMAQKLKSESASKRLSVSSSVASSHEKSQNLSGLNDESSTNQYVAPSFVTTTTTNNNNTSNSNKRMLSEIKPTNVLPASSASSNANSSENEDLKDKIQLSQPVVAKEEFSLPTRYSITA